MTYKGGSAKQTDVLIILVGKYPELDFTGAEYLGSKKPIVFKCQVHGIQERRASRLLEGRGCAKCGNASASKRSRIGLKNLIARFIAIHGNSYDYSKLTCTQQTDMITLNCAIHGDFDIRVTNHLQKAGCQKCGVARISIARTGSLSSFIERSVKLHGGRYSYTDSKYDGYHTNIEIRCKEHGVFKQTPNNHLQGKGCSTCGYGESKGEQELAEYVKSLGFEMTRNDRSIINPFEIDIYIPELKIAIEYNGLYWHSDKVVPRQYHKLKRRLCKDKDIRLIQVLEDEWLTKKEAIKGLIANACGISKRIYARNTEVTYANNTEFFNRYHHSGDTSSSFRVSLEHKGEIVMAISLRRCYKNRKEVIKGRFEIARMASNASVVGGMSKLLKHAIALSEAKEIETFCDIRLFTGSSWSKLGFIWQHRTEPTPWKVKGVKRLHPRSFTKGNLKNIPNPEKYNTLYDCGHDKYLLTV